jgi:hypothetical protein
MILTDGSWAERNTVVDDQLVPAEMRAELLDYEDLSGHKGKVMVLHETRYEEKRMLNGQPAWVPTTIQAGELIERELLPSMCKEGTHFVTEWDEKLRARTRYEAEQEEQKLLQSDPLQIRESGGMQSL